jgi:hypothetical protein
MLKFATHDNRVLTLFKEIDVLTWLPKYRGLLDGIT